MGIIRQRHGEETATCSGERVGDIVALLYCCAGCSDLLGTFSDICQLLRGGFFRLRRHDVCAVNVLSQGGAFSAELFLLCATVSMVKGSKA